MCNKLDNIVQDGFCLSDQNVRLRNLALISLRIALQAYFGTYQPMRYFLHIFDGKHGQKVIDFNHSIDYSQNCAECIVHFQHFAELICKDFLRAEHQLLAIDASNKPVILDKLLKNEPVTDQDLEGVQSIEFAESLKRLCALIRDRKLGKGKLDFILSAKPLLERLNGLRNRAWHRGIFILRYPALDQLVGGFVLPLIQNVTAIEEYAAMEEYWRYEPISCEIDPIEEIIKECATGSPDIGKIALLKELGRAAYDNPLKSDVMSEYFNEELKRRATHIAQSERSEPGVSAVKDCPVCGVKSLVVYDEMEIDEGDTERDEWTRAYRYTWQVECTCCTFKINHHLKNPSVYGLKMEDYWEGEEL
jgi:hypothetical protein